MDATLVYNIPLSHTQTIMKISNIEVYVLQTELDTPFAFSQGWVERRSATLVKVTADNGLCGWGEAFAQGLEPPQIAAAVIEYALKPLLLNACALDTSVLWHRLYHTTRDYGRKGSVIAAISAIDIALWDLAGHYYQQPVYQLLGGAFRTEIQPYATGFYRIQGKNEANRLADEAVMHYENGYEAMKVKLGFGLDDDIAVMHSIAEALGDRTVELMVDTNHAYGYREALTLGRELELFNIRWYEEPVVPEDTESYQRLRKKLNIPIAGGENEHTPYGFKQLFAVGAVDIAQPDIGSCGGFTAARDIVAMGQAHGVGINPHVWGSAVAQAASLQLLAALPVTHHALFPSQPLLEFDCSSHPFRNALIAKPWEMQNGTVSIPTGPGLGIEIVPETIEKYRINL